MTATNVSKWDEERLVEAALTGDAGAQAELERRGKAAAPALAKAVSKKGGEWRWWGVDLLGKIGGAESIEPLIAILEEGDAKIAGWAAWSLGELQDRRAVEPLMRALKSPDKEVREKAVQALDRLRDPRAVEPLMEIVAGDSSWYVRCQAASALEHLKDPRAIPALLKALEYKGEAAEHLAVNAANALRALGARVPLASLLSLLEDERKVSNVSSIEHVLTESAAQDLDALLSGLRSPSARVRLAAASAVVDAADERFREPLVACLEDPDKSVRGAARAALKAMRRRGIQVEFPKKPLGETIRDAVGLLFACYFIVPSTEGFSAYRTGFAVHLLFSIMFGAAAGGVFMATHPGAVLGRFLVCFSAVFLLWGVGVWAGILSHYNALIFIAAIGGVILAARLTHDDFPAWILIAGVSHLVIAGTLRAAHRLFFKEPPKG